MKVIILAVSTVSTKTTRVDTGTHCIKLLVVDYSDDPFMSTFD